MSSHTVSSSGSEMEGGSIGNDCQYSNSKLRRLDSSSFYEQAQSPVAIISSIYKDLNWVLTRDLVLSAVWFYIGVYSWKQYIAEHGWLRIRPIPYQLTQAGDVLLDLTLTNDLVEKPDQIFPCELEDIFIKCAHLMHQYAIPHSLHIHLIHYILLSFIQAYKLWFIALKLPLIIVIAIGAIFPLVISNIPKNNPLVNIHHGTCTILVAIGLSEFICNTAKVYVGRLESLYIVNSFVHMTIGYLIWPSCIFI